MPAAIAPPAEVEALVAALVAVDSVNPSLVPGGAGEGAIADFVTARATAAGLEVERVASQPDRPSVLVTARGSGGGRTLLLCGHLDTVGVEGMEAPHAPVVCDGRLHGRGSYDMKGGLAACLLAAEAAAGAGLAGDVVVAAVADEEHSSLGIQDVLARVRADACVVTEPTALDIVIAHKGFAWWEIEAIGRAAHGSRPDLGVDAITALAPVLRELALLERELAKKAHPLLGPASVHASTITGGVELSTYPERCVLGIERRTLPEEGEVRLQAELDRLAAAGRERRVPDTAAGIVARSTLVRRPFSVEPDEPIVLLVGQEAERRLGRAPRRAGHAAWMDAAFTSAAGIPTVVFGPDGAGAHALEEWVDLASVRTCAEVLLATAEAFCA